MITTEYRIKDIGEVVGGGTPRTDIPDYWDGNIPWISPVDLSSYSNIYISKGQNNITELGLKKSSTKLLPKDTVLLSSRAPIGYLAIAANEICTNQGFKSIICDKNKVEPLFLYYYLKLNIEQLKSFATGATFPELSGNTLKKIKVQLPPLPTQQKIASILSAYDNLIQNYKKQIEALQTVASELYKEWFVRFRFPGWQNAKFENGIPEGWQIARVGDYVKIKSGFAFKSEWWQDEGCPVVKIKDIDNGEIVITDLDFVSEEHTKKAKSFLLNEGDLVIAMTGATIGKIGLAPKIKNLYTNQRVGKFFLPENPFETMPFLYCLFSQNSTVETILCLSGASSAQPNISPDQLESIKFFFNEDIVFQFNKKSAPFFRKILKLREQITNLTQQRDLLLPRLMSGKLEV